LFSGTRIEGDEPDVGGGEIDLVLVNRQAANGAEAA
jgi:hypothetical protein